MQKLLLNWFGSIDKDSDINKGETQAGNLIFFDALPIEPVSLVVDIMTPHMGDWYQNGAKNPDTPQTVPADWHDPVPIAFLATKGISLQFSFGIRPRLSSEASDNIDLEDVKMVLTSALKYQGAGGKTAAGYGGLTFDVKKAEDQKVQQDNLREETANIEALKEAQAKMTPLAAEFFEYVQENNWKADKNAFWKKSEIEVWLDKLEKEYDKQLWQELYDLMEIHFKGVMTNPEKTKGKMNKAVYKPRVQKIAKNLLKLS